MRKLRRILARGAGRRRRHSLGRNCSLQRTAIIGAVTLACVAVGAGISLASSRARTVAAPSLAHAVTAAPRADQIAPARPRTRLGAHGIPANAKLVPSMSTPTSRTYLAPSGIYSTVIYGQVIDAKRPSTSASLLPPGPPPPVGGGSGVAKQDCTLASSSPTTSLCPSTNDVVGYDGTNTDNTVIEFKTESIPKENVLNAQVGMYLSSASTSNAVSVSAYAVPSGRSWTESATWNTYDGTHAWTSPGGDFSSTHAFETSVTTAVGWKYWYPTQIVQEWAAGTLPNDGLLLADTTQKQTVDMLSFNSTKATENRPFMTVSWTKRGQQDDSRYSFQPFRIDDRSSMAVNLGSGNLFIDSNDLTVKGTGLPFHTEHDYNSLNRELHYLNPWSGNAPVTELYDDGSITFNLPHYDWLVFIKQPNGSFLTPPGINATLCKIEGEKCTKNSGDSSEATYALTFNTNGNGSWYKAGTKWTWGPTAGLLSIADRYGNKLVYHYCCTENGFTDTQGRKFKRHTTEVGGNTYYTGWTEEPSAREVKYEYNASNQLTTYVDALGHKTKYAYDEEGELHELTDPNGKVTTFNYNEASQITKITQPEVAGKHPVWEYAYFAASDTTHGHNCETENHGLQGTATQKTVVTDPNGHQSTFCSDEEDMVLQSYDAAGNKTSAAFNSIDQLTSTTAAAPGSGESANVQSFVYQEGSEGTGRLNCTITGTETKQESCPETAGGSMLVTNFKYTNETNKFLPTRIENPEGQSTFACYNEEKRPEEGHKCPTSASGPKGSLQNVVDPLSSENELSFEYNSNGTIKSSKDADGHVTSYEYDEHGNLKKIIPASGTETGEKLEPTTITVDSDSRPHVITDGEGHIETITYDKLDRPTEIAYTGTGTAKTVKLEYDANGNVIKREDPTGTTKYTLDALNRITKEALPGSLANEYGYDSASNMTSFTDGGGTTKYAYNNLNELEAITEPGESKQTKFSYDGDHRLTKVVYPSEATEVYKLEATTGRPESISFEHLSGISVPNLTYAYKNGTNNTQLIQSLSESSGPKTAYKYDPLNRLESAVKESSSKEVESKYVFKLDGDGNRTEQVAKVTPKETEKEATTYYITNVGNLLECRQTVKPSEAKCSGSSSTELSHYKYDKAGEETEIIPKADTAGTTFAFNAGKELSSLTPSGSEAKALSYGGTGQDDLVKLGSSTSIQNSLLGLTREVASSGTSYYARTPNGLLVDERTPSGHFNPLYDAQGDVIALVSTTGKVERTFQYGPYGENTESSGTQTIPDPFGYKGGYRVPGGNVGKGNVSNGLYHFGQRYYDPTTGRWTQRDPLSQLASPVQANRFAFAGNNPINLGDPQGVSVEAYAERCGAGALNGAVASSPGGVEAAAGGAVSGCAAEVATTAVGELFGEEAEEVAEFVGEVATLHTAVKSAKAFYHE